MQKVKKQYKKKQIAKTRKPFKNFLIKLPSYFSLLVTYKSSQNTFKRVYSILGFNVVSNLAKGGLKPF